MRKTIIALGALLALPLSSPGFADDDPNLDLIAARKGEMTLRSFFLGPLVGMAKGEVPYDAAKAAQLAANLKHLGGLEMGPAWAPGTDLSKYPEHTTALAEIWSNYPEIAEYGKEYTAAVDALASSAGEGLNQLRATIGDVGKSCKGCHDEYREKN